MSVINARDATRALPVFSTDAQRNWVKTQEIDKNYRKFNKDHMHTGLIVTISISRRIAGICCSELAFLPTRLSQLTGLTSESPATKLPGPTGFSRRHFSRPVCSNSLQPLSHLSALSRRVIKNPKPGLSCTGAVPGSNGPGWSRLWA